MDNTVTLLGLALRAGRLEAGEDCARDACKAKACRLLLVARDASDGTARRAMFAAELVSTLSVVAVAAAIIVRVLAF